MPRKQMTDGDAQLLRTLIAKYGIDGVSLEVERITRAWGAQSMRYLAVAKEARKLAYLAGVSEGTQRLAKV